VPARPNSNPHSTRRKSQPDQPAVATGNALEILRSPSLAALPWLVHGFSTRQGGVSTCYGGRNLNLGLTPADSKENVARNRALFLEALGAASENSGGAWPLVQMKQMHSAVVHRVSAPPRGPLAGDGIITDTPGLLLAIKTADCVPVLIADVKRRVIGAFHAGWRGTAARIVEKGVGEMRRQFGSAPRDLRAAIGPSIRRCCYQVGPEVRAEFDSQFSYSGDLFEEVFDADAIHVRYPMLFLTARAPGHSELGPELHLDLVEANRRQLEDAGVPAEHISVVDGCTACDTARFYSHRAAFGKTGRMMAAIGIRTE
jgi:YfiH family protein